MSATQNKAAWDKYYLGKVPLTTTVSKETFIYDAKTETKTKSKAPVGTVVTVLTQSYNKKTLVEFKVKVGSKKITGRLDINDLKKPPVNPSTGAPVKATGKSLSNEKTITNKSLTPNELKIAGKKIKKADYIETVTAAVKNSKAVLPYVKLFLIQFLEKSATTNATLTTGAGISKKDLAIIAKDFGEIAGAWWFINNYDSAETEEKSKLDYIEFPSAIAEPLVDYYVGYSSIDISIRVSAKADKGAAPGLISVWKAIEKNAPKDNPKAKEVWEFIKIAADTTILGIQSLVDCNKHFNSTAYRLIKDKFFPKKDFTWEDVEKFIAPYKSGKALYEILDKSFYAKINRQPENGAVAIDKILKAGKKKSGIILSPMSYSLMDEVNTTKHYTEYLNTVCKSLKVEQLYVKLTNTTLQYKLKSFAKSEFIFDYHSNAGDPAANKYGFKMKK